MNLLPGTAVGEGANVIVGIRPETLRPAAELAGGVAIEIVAEVVEPLGSDVFVHGRTDAGQEVVARLPGNARVAAGERVALAVPAVDVHRFDAETGERLG
jgi:sn-glycerol 3-phosphate transport system ATP-binding protein